MLSVRQAETGIYTTIKSVHMYALNFITLVVNEIYFFLLSR